MQQRVPIKKFAEFDLAKAAKDALQITNPDVTYQVRRHGEGFNVVRRFPVNAIKSFEEHYTKKRSGPSKRHRKGSIDPAFLSDVRKRS